MLAEAYLQLQKKQMKEIEDFPIAYAFSEEQLKEALEKLGASKDECCTVCGHGDIMKKVDAKRFIEMLKRHTQETKDLLLSDKNIAYEAFLYEMNNHEYVINWSGDEDVLDCFGMDISDLREMDLELTYQLARREHMRIANEEWELI